MMCCSALSFASFSSRFQNPLSASSVLFLRADTFPRDYLFGRTEAVQRIPSRVSTYPRF